MNGNNNNRTEDEDTNTNNQEAVKSSSSGEYYARGCAELATESALTLAKIEHVSRIWGLGGVGDTHALVPTKIVSTDDWGGVCCIDNDVSPSFFWHK
jgi:hypothetical protein